MTKKALSAAISAALFAGFCNTAFAQLEEVIVTAQKREQTANDIGMAISTLSADTIKDFVILDTTDLALAVPGLTYSDSGLATPIYTLRGVGFNEQSVQATSTVGIYQDQIGIPFPIMSKGLLMDNERVEVMKGPQGTLFGRNSTGGAINYIANKPADEFEASVTAGYSRFETVDIGGFVSGPLTDNMQGRLAVRTVQSGEGWQKSVSRNDEHGEVDKYALRGLLAIQGGDSLNILLSASYWSDQSDSTAPSFLIPAYQNFFGNPNPVVVGLLDSGEDARISTLGDDDNRAADWVAGSNNRLGGAPEFDMNSTTFSASIFWDVNESITLTSLTSYSKFENDSRFQNDGYGGMSPDKAIGGISAQDTIAAIVRDQYDGYDRLFAAAYTNESDIESWFQEIRLSGEYNNLVWIVGANYSDDEIDSTTPNLVDINTSTNVAYYPIPGEIGVQTTVNTTEQAGESWAVFAHSEWNFAEAWKLTLGIRYDEDEKDFSGCSRDDGNGDAAQFLATLAAGAGLSPNLVPGGCITFPNAAVPGVPFDGFLVEKELNEDSTSGKLALDWNVTDDILTYISYSRGYKSGSFPTLGATIELQLDPVVQEKVDAYELGMKARLMDGLAQLNMAAFYYDYTDKQLLSRVPVPPFGALETLQNVPESEVTGAEFDFQWAPIDGLLIGLAATYTDTEVKKFTGYNQFGEEQDFSGSKFPLTPEWQGMATAQYEWDLNNGMKAFVGGDVTYSDDFTTDFEGPNGVDPVFELEDVTLLGARAGLRAADYRWDVTVWGRNLTDEFRPINTRKITDGVIRYTGMPTTYGVTLSYNWL